jgi:hypothetical protein
MSQANETTTSRRTLLTRAVAATALAGAAGANVAAIALTTGLDPAPADPVFDLIDQHRAAVAEYNRAEAVSGQIVIGLEWEAAFAVTSAAMDRSYDLLEVLLRAQPATIAGAIALLEHLGQDEYLGVDWGGGAHERRTLLSVFSDSSRNCIDRKRLAEDFPLCLASALRILARNGGARG